MNEIERVVVINVRFKKMFSNLIQKINSENIKRIASGIKRQSAYYSIEAWFVDENLEQTKQYLSDIGLLYHFSNFPKLTGSGSDFDFGYIFCSDNKKVINACASLTQHRNYYTDGGGLVWPSNAIANAYLGNWDLLQEDCYYINKSFGKQLFVKNIIAFYEALMQSNQEEMKKNVEILGSKDYWKKTQIKSDLLPKFVLFPALTFAKLMWIKGFEVDFESEYIPKEWLPIQPLDNYEISYEFIKNHVIEFNLI